MNYVQSNTKRGPFQIASATDMTGKEGYLVKILDASGTPKATLPAAVTDVAAYVITNVISTSVVEIMPLEPGVSVRLVANGTTLLAGDKVVGYASGKEGLASEYTGSGAAFISAIAEETGGTDLQYVKCRPVLTYWTA